MGPDPSRVLGPPSHDLDHDAQRLREGGGYNTEGGCSVQVSEGQANASVTAFKAEMHREWFRDSCAFSAARRYLNAASFFGPSGARSQAALTDFSWSVVDIAVFIAIDVSFLTREILCDQAAPRALAGGLPATRRSFGFRPSRTSPARRGGRCNTLCAGKSAVRCDHDFHPAVLAAPGFSCIGRDRFIESPTRIRDAACRRTVADQKPGDRQGTVLAQLNIVGF